MNKLLSSCRWLPAAAGRNQPGAAGGWAAGTCSLGLRVSEQVMGLGSWPSILLTATERNLLFLLQSGKPAHSISTPSPAPPPAKCIPGTGAGQLGQETSSVPPAKALLAGCFPPPALKYWILVGANAEVDPERETFRSFSAASVLLSGQIPELLSHLWSSQFLLLWVGMLRADPTATSFSSDMSIRAGKSIFYYCVVREIPWELASSKALTPSGNVLANRVGGWSYSPSAYDGLSISMGFGKLYPDIWY